MAKSEAMMQQASHVWQMLDDMASNDPQAYKKFIDKHVKEGKEYMKQPEPHMCVQTAIQGTLTPFYINIFCWQRIPKPKTDEDPIPCMGGEMYKIKEEGNENDRVVCVGFNTEVTDAFGIDSHLVEERKMLVNLAIDFVENQHKVKLCRGYTVLHKEKCRCKGPVELAIQTLTKRYGGKDEEFKQQLDDIEKNLGPMAAGCKDSIMNQLSNIATSDSKDKTNGSHLDSSIRMPYDTNTKKSLIEEVSSEPVATPSPEYSLDVMEDSFLVLKVNLKGVQSVTECDLDISKRDVHLQVGSMYDLKVTLPRIINEDAAKAKFHKKSSTLKLTLPIAT